MANAFVQQGWIPAIKPSNKTPSNRDNKTYWNNISTVTADLVRQALSWVFTHPLCEVKKTNAEGMRIQTLLRLTEILAGESGLAKDDTDWRINIKSSLEKDIPTIDALIADEVERERKEKINYWLQFMRDIENEDYVRGERENGKKRFSIWTTKADLTTIWEQQLQLLWVASEEISLPINLES